MQHEHGFISETDYRNHSAISRSQVWRMITKSPAHALIPTPATNAMELGTAIHQALLEPHKFTETFLCGPDNRRGNKWKDAVAEAEANNQLILTAPDYEKVERITDAVLSNSLARSMILSNSAVKEYSSFFKHEHTGLQCKARFDVFDESAGTIIDLKTTADASKDAFSRSCANYGYHLQAAWYLMAHEKAHQFVFIAVEREEPYAISFYELDENSLADGESLMRKGLEQWKECVELDHWPTYPQKLQEVSIPHWAMMRFLNLRS